MKALTKAILVSWMGWIGPGTGALAAMYGWRRDGTGIIGDAAPPIGWSVCSNVLWQAEVGGGYSSPIVAGGSVFVVSEPDTVLCLDVQDGRLRWKTSVNASDLPPELRDKVHDIYPEGTSGNTAATPVTDGRSLFTVFGNGIVACLDPATGHRKWVRWIDTEPRSTEGRSASPLLCDGRLIVHLTELFALDPETGATLWRQPSAEDAYGSPVAAQVGDMHLIVTPAGCVVRASDGKILAEGIGSCLYATPVVSNGRLFFPGTLCVGVELSANAGNEALDVREVWTDHLEGEVYSSPVVWEGRLYVCTTDARLYVFDFAQKKRFHRPLELDPLPRADASGPPASPDPERAVWSSLTLAGRLLYVSRNDGKTAVLEPGPEPRTIRVNTLPTGSGSTPAFAGTRLFIRGGDQLYCVGE